MHQDVSAILVMVDSLSGHERALGGISMRENTRAGCSGCREGCMDYGRDPDRDVGDTPWMEDLTLLTAYTILLLLSMDSIRPKSSSAE